MLSSISRLSVTSSVEVLTVIVSDVSTTIALTFLPLRRLVLYLRSRPRRRAIVGFFFKALEIAIPVVCPLVALTSSLPLLPLLALVALLLLRLLIISLLIITLHVVLRV